MFVVPELYAPAASRVPSRAVYSSPGTSATAFASASHVLFLTGKEKGGNERVWLIITLEKYT